MILNRYFNYIDHDRIVEHESTAYYLLRDFDKEPGAYWYLEFKLSLAKLHEAIPPDVLRAIINGNIGLMLCNSHEAFHEVISEIYEHAINRLGIHEQKIVLLTESADIFDEVEIVAARLNKLQITVKWARMFERSVAIDKEFLERCGNKIQTLVDKPYTKKFINFNRRWRFHRPTLVALLHARNLLEKGYVSLAPCDDNMTWERVWGHIMHLHQYNGSILQSLVTNKDRIMSLPPLYLDSSELMTNLPNLTDTTDSMYENTYFSVVAETNYYDHQPGRFLSEKTFKPIGQRHPFIIVSVPNMLPLLRGIGYKTFSPFINETYDTETDSSTRMLLLIEEIERLSNLTPDELTEFLDGVRPICEHNYQVLKSKTSWITDLN